MVLGVNRVMWNEVISVVNIVSIIDTHNAPPHMDEATGTSELGTIRLPRVSEFFVFIYGSVVVPRSLVAAAVSHYDNLALERLYLLVHLAYAAPVPGADAIGVGVVLRRIRGICAMIVLAALADPKVVGGAAVPFRVHPRVVVLARCEVFLVRGGVEDWPTIEPIFLRRRIHKLRVPDACVPRRRLEPKRQCVAHICRSACGTH